MLRRLKDYASKDLIAIVLLVIGSALFYAATYNRSSYSYILRADEGVSFATAVRVTQGFIPQHDFPSYYGPLMPYVYGTAFKAFGASIALMRGIWAILCIASIVLFYRLGRHLLPPFAAFAAAAMLIGQQHTPLYTYNHIGFVLATQGILMMLLNGMSSKATGHFRLKMAALLLMALLIKFNEAFVVFVVVVVVLGVANWRREENPLTETPQTSWMIIPGTAAFAAFTLITAGLNIGLTKFQFLRNFPLLPQYQASIGGYQYVKFILTLPFRMGWHEMTARRWYFFWYENYVFSIIVSFIVGILVLFCTIRFFASSKYRKGLGPDSWKAILLAMIAVVVYHEFYLTGNHWSTPMYVGFSLVALTFLIWQGLSRFPLARTTVVAALLLLCVASDLYYVRVVYHTYSQFRIDEPRARIYSSADSDAPVVSSVVAFLESETPSGTSMAAFPHDASLLYLAGRQNAMRDDDYQWMLFPNEASDLEIARELDAKKVQRIVLSNFVGIRRGQPVIFGRDYLPETFKYIQTHYGVVKTFGANPRAYQVQYLELIDAAGATPAVK
jgi:4-amino-4-deoxy-L-arabinose transferase-like glycosyltransferase